MGDDEDCDFETATVEQEQEEEEEQTEAADEEDTLERGLKFSGSSCSLLNTTKSRIIQRIHGEGEADHAGSSRGSASIIRKRFRGLTKEVSTSFVENGGPEELR